MQIVKYGHNCTLSTVFPSMFLVSGSDSIFFILDFYLLLLNKQLKVTSLFGEFNCSPPCVHTLWLLGHEEA